MSLSAAVCHCVCCTQIMGFLETKRYQGFKETGSVSPSSCQSTLLQSSCQSTHRVRHLLYSVTAAARLACDGVLSVQV